MWVALECGMIQELRAGQVWLEHWGGKDMNQERLARTKSFRVS